MRWDEDIKSVKGIGEKTSVSYRKLGIDSVNNLLMHFPRNYDEFTEIINISDIVEGRTVIIKGTIATRPTLKTLRRFKVVNVVLRDSTGSIPLVWFNMPFMAKTLRVGTYYIVRGKAVRKNGVLEIDQPQLLTNEDYYNSLHKLLPIYPLTEGISNNAIRKAVSYALENTDFPDDYVPLSIRKENNLQGFKSAVKTIHFPQNRNELIEARKRLAFDEFFAFLLMLRYFKGNNEKLPTRKPYVDGKMCAEFISSLPYTLTNAQLNVWEDIRSDMKTGYVMNRLVQGDVGSGKTILAALSLLMNYENGYQGALMVPTEVLAKQHYESISEMFAPYGIKVGLLVGSMTASAKKKVYAEIEANEVNIVIGTHALIQEKVEYANLGLVITDEQHRFGVNQRRALSSKGEECHMMVMSATPIPRTLAIILYGEMDISVVNELPSNRLPIMNCVVGTSYRPTAYKFMYNEINKGSQVYIICPMVDESESVQLENVTDYYVKLSEVMPENIRIDILHGKMKASQKNDVMNRFAAGEIDILISTTVIEVGINVPNATVMMIENAERFGLAQLHQLRGRVGRGDKQSYCIFMSGNTSKETMERLEILNKSNDGFHIASEDLKLRGPGDMFGIRQSGDLVFEMADIYQDADMLMAASEAVKNLSYDDVEILIDKLPNKSSYDMLGDSDITL